MVAPLIADPLHANSTADTDGQIVSDICDPMVNTISGHMDNVRNMVIQLFNKKITTEFVEKPLAFPGTAK